MGKGVSVRTVGLDLLFMGVNFSALTLFSTLKDFFASEYGMTPTQLQWAAAAYSIGIFAAFFIGHSKYVEEHPKATVLAAAILAAIPQFLIPVSGSPVAVIALRFLQGLVMMAVPIFSSQVGTLFSHARPLALGIILSGIFIGGFIGSNVGWQLAVAYGWRTAYMVFGLAMLIAALIWIGLTSPETLPRHAHKAEVSSVSKGSVWRKPFTIVWGFTFFPSIWIIFTLAPLIAFIVTTSFGAELARISSETLEASYIFWSITIGAVAYLVSRRGSGNPRQLFKSFAYVQAACFVFALIGALSAYAASMSGNATALLASLFILAVIQGTAPTFWSIPSTAYPREEVTRAGYALGLISNSAAMIGPVASILVASLSTSMWLLTSFLSLMGLVLTLAALKLKLPIEEVGENT